MSLFDIEDKIDYNWLIDNGFSTKVRYGDNDKHIITKILRTRNPFIYININYITLDATLQWIPMEKGPHTGIEMVGKTQIFYLGRIDDRLKMLSIIHKYSQENCLI